MSLSPLKLRRDSESSHRSSEGSGALFSPGGSSKGGDHDVSSRAWPDDPAQVLELCMQLFSRPDFIMETEIIPALSQYFQVGGQPEPIIDSLADNYVGTAQLCNLMGGWLLDFETDKASVVHLFEQQLCDVVERHFSPKQADQFFYASTATDMEWLGGLVSQKCWRTLIYRLAEKHGDCLFLNFAVKLCSDAGYQDEISNVHTAAQQLEIFSRVLRKTLDDLLEAHGQSGGCVDTKRFESSLNDFVRTAYHSEATYLYTQALLHCLASDEEKTSQGVAHACRYISQVLRDRAPDGQDTTAITMALMRTDKPKGLSDSLMQAMQSMITKRTLNPADMQLLYDAYHAKDLSTHPPIKLLRDPIFLELCVDALFRPSPTVKLPVDRRQKYTYLLAYASSAWDYPTQHKHARNRDDLAATERTLTEMSGLCQGRDGVETSSELLVHVNRIFQAIKTPIVAVGVLHWIECVVSEPKYFRAHPEPVPIHLALLDELASQHSLLHSRIFKFLTALFDRESDCSGEQLLDRQRNFIDRLVHLLSCGYSFPVLEFIRDAEQTLRLDTSLIRYFVCETLEIVSPPYSREFMQILLPLVENETIVDENVKDKVPTAVEFLTFCHQQTEPTTEAN